MNNYSERFKDYFEGYGSGTYNPATEQITLDIALGKPYSTKTILIHAQVLGEFVGQDQGKITVSGPTKDVITAPDIKKDKNNIYDLKLLIKRHLILTHELVHRRLTMDTAYGFILRFYGLAKVYLNQNKDHLDESEINYLKALQARYELMLKVWMPFQEYVAGYCTWTEIHYLLAMISLDEKIGSCECSSSIFEEHIGNLETYSKQQIINYLEDLKEKLKQQPFLNINYMVAKDEEIFQGTPPIIKAEILKHNFMLVYLAIYLSASDLYNGHDLALCELDLNFFTQRAHSVHYLYETCMHFVEKNKFEDCLRTLLKVFFTDNEDSKEEIGSIFRRADLFCRKRVKMKYHETILEAKDKLKFGFFDFALNKIGFWGNDRVLWPMPSSISQDGYVTEIKLMNRSDHLLFFWKITKGENFYEESNENNELLFDEYAIDLIYGALFSTKEYENIISEMGGFPISGHPPYCFTEIISGGHDVGSILNLLYCKS
jgi:hypothetical protein